MLRVAALALLCAGCFGHSAARDAQIDCINREVSVRDHSRQLAAYLDRIGDEIARCDATLVAGIETTEGAVRCAHAHEYQQQAARELAQDDRYADEVSRSCVAYRAQADADDEDSRRSRHAIGAALQGLGNGLSAAGQVQRPVSCSSLVVGNIVQTNCY